ncbi:MAG TPA: DUF2232 domain-containing protein [Tissierellaceae bacterium]|nr:DUF2232 domain-containing protein [Tissierellaceae bacterium]
MSNSNKIKDNKLEDMILIIVMSIYAIFGMYYIPYMLVLFPVPFVIYGMKNGITRNIMNLIVTCIIVGIAESIEYGLLLLIMFTPGTLLFYYLIKKRKRPMEIIGIVTITFFISILIILGFVNTLGIDFMTELENEIHEMFESQIESIEDMDFTSYEFAKEQDLLEERYELSLLIIPSVLFVLSLIASYLNYLLISFGLRKLDINIITRPKFSNFRLPDNIVLGLITMFIGIFIMEKMDLGYTDVIIINLVTLISLMFSIQGLAVLDYFLGRFNIFPLIRFITYLMLLFNSAMVIMLTIVGFIDTIFDLRKRKNKS